ncbi:monocarboxylate transporter 12-like [Gigantopelta aegis]|uniref:monocarboxylate transporter 12-like n=1 Tax=Gigantopelta aegis TaxID=1735272 RepID=UPI001B88A748|nr:monocarboxylate transporter 12-like [Gigantopelta aegis]
MLSNTSFSFVAGVLHVALLEASDDDVTLVTWIGSLYSCMFALAGPFASILINTWGCRICVIASGLLGLVGFSVSSLVVGSRWLFLTYALLAGLGQGLAYTGSLVNLGYYFRERTSLATCIGILSCGIGNIVLPVLTQALIDSFHLDGAFLLIGGISFQTCVCGMVMRPSKFERIARENRIERDTTTNSDASKLSSAFKRWTPTWRPLFSNYGFLFFVLSSFWFTVGSSTIKLYLPDFLITQGASLDHAALLVSYIGAGSTAARFGLGIAASDSEIDSAILFAGVNVITSLILSFIIQIMQSNLGQILFVLAYGCYNGGSWTLFNPITYELVGIDHLATALGLVMFTCGVGYLVGAPAAGWIYQLSGNYYHAFLFSAVAFFVTSICGVLAATCNQLAVNVHTKRLQHTVQDIEIVNLGEHEQMLK